MNQAIQTKQCCTNYHRQHVRVFGVTTLSRVTTGFFGLWRPVYTIEHVKNLLICTLQYYLPLLEKTQKIAIVGNGAAYSGAQITFRCSSMVEQLPVA
jgi:hypothetical protein